MNKKIVKLFSCCLLSTCLFSAVLLNGFNGYAVESIIIDDVDISNYVDNYNYQYISKLSNEKAIIYKNALKSGLSNKKLGKQSIDKVIENIDKLAATIDVAPGGAKAAISALISKVRKQKAMEIILNKLSQLGLGAFKEQIKKALPWIVALTSLDRGIASFIDSIDFHKDNGRINLWP
ncbi:MULTISPECIES: hypothetical protein [unclassified Granulicatella]|uniref:hypothetical protein n=1 Tax=unclassified Granulicatella TaxID=2630493 RepID=UPI0010746708|nr:MULTISPECIES: hypothetical protein [unclassified Granulicatella]MBF0780382.1 hypothetical protein [Granulicatella sp. 19428wC4_WM01]TFU95470.1 hypothetical protein E4T68_04690 [Granulicatella sp. WM01]